MAGHDAEDVASLAICARSSGTRGRLFRGPAEAVVERIAGSPHGADRVGELAAIDRFAQAPDMHVDGALVDIDVAAPDAVEQLLARENAARALHQKLQQAIFGRPQIDGAAAARDPPLVAVEFDVADAEHAV